MENSETQTEKRKVGRPKGSKSLKISIIKVKKPKPEKKIKVKKLPEEIDQTKRIYYNYCIIKDKKYGRTYSYYKQKLPHLINNDEFLRLTFNRLKDLKNHPDTDKIDINEIVNLYNKIDDLYNLIDKDNDNNKNNNEINNENNNKENI